VKLKLEYGFFIVSLIIIYSCSSSSTDNALNFLFDGVPQSDSIITSSGPLIISDTTDILTTKNQNVYPQVYIHAPYAEQMCESCHDIKASYKKTMDIPELCYQCHDDFQKTYKNLHYPIEAGECKSCHHPHQAKLSKLLIKSVRELCAECHDLKELIAGDMHSGMEETDCTNCHNPHGSDESSLLK
jgi:predicted CXXCH cytochrome family protein